MPPLSNKKFLKQCGIEHTSSNFQTCKRMREELYEIATTSEIDNDLEILPDHRMTTDLGIHPLDSLNLIDLAASLESEHLKILDEDAEQIAALNQNDGTTADLLKLLSKIETKQPED